MVNLVINGADDKIEYRPRTGSVTPYLLFRNVLSTLTEARQEGQGPGIEALTLVYRTDVRCNVGVCPHRHQTGQVTPTRRSARPGHSCWRSLDCLTSGRPD